ncbi:MAG: protein of unknown function acetylesterase [Lacrimispora sp.]|nr:protein of unknown function acetylesterase [Lacrimispora sp.]
MTRIKLPEIFQNGMIIQRNKTIKIWGEAEGAERLTISFCGDSALADVKEGKFYCEISAKEAAIGQKLKISSDEKKKPDIVLEDICIGDIYIAAGQSNMEYFLRYDAHWNEIKKWEQNDMIRMFNCKRIAYPGQKRDQPECGDWFKEHDSQWESFSAPGYSFARAIQTVIGVPVGIIGCNWGGTPACAWMGSHYLNEEPLSVFQREYEETLKSADEEEIRRCSRKAWEYEDSYLHQVAWRAMMYGMNEQDQERWLLETANAPILPMGPYHQNRPSGLYELMLKELVPFSVKGVLWYQGESDAGHGEIYDKTFSSLIRCWRDLWQDELPFLFVQLAPFGKWLGIEGQDYPVVRESQERVAKCVPGTGMISIMDLGMYEDIHPKQKKEVGERLALLARGLIYGEDILCESPEFISGEREANWIRLRFSHTGENLYTKGNSIKSLCVNQGGILREIKDFKLGRDLLLCIETLTEEPVEIRFAKEGYCEVNLFSEADLPVKPFTAVIV